MSEGFRKEERLCNPIYVDKIFHEGKKGKYACISYTYLNNKTYDYNRVLFSAPKRIFKRAVKRNRIKRLLREAYRREKFLLETKGLDIVFVYNSRSLPTFSEIRLYVKSILQSIDKDFKEAANYE